MDAPTVATTRDEKWYASSVDRVSNVFFISGDTFRYSKHQENDRQDSDDA